MTADLRDELQRSLGSTYIIDRELGGGGMSRVFAAEERSLARKVALKILPPELAGQLSAERFRREVQLTAALQHPHIVPVLSTGEADGLLYYTTPLIEGESLRQRLSREGELSVSEALRILREVASALSYAHAHGVVHRDIKPDNVLLSGPYAMVTDFGIAKAVGAESEQAALTGTGVSVGTPAYMAPEQITADPRIDHRADLYAFGVLAYELLTGALPFHGASAQAVLAAHVTRAPDRIEVQRPAVPRALCDLVARCLEKRPADRPQSADEIIRSLETIAPNPGLAAAPTSWRPILITAGLAVIVTLIVGALFSARRRSASGSAAASIATVAVLPFVNVGGDRDNEYFSDGMTEELISALTKIEGLRVPARTSSFAFKGKNLSVQAIAESLHVGAVLEGTVRRAGDRLRVGARLINAADGYQMWSESYERQMVDVFSVQDDIARAIVTALQVRLAGGRNRPLVAPPTTDVRAYDLYLKGRFAWNQRTATSLRDAISFFEQAIAADSRFALAYVGLADAHAVMPTYAGTPRRDNYAQATSAIRKALDLDSTLAEAQATLGLLRIQMFDWSDSERAFKRAIALNPRYATAYHWYAIMLWCNGRLPEGRVAAERAIALDPLSRIIGVVYGIQFYYERDFEGAITQFRRVLALDANYGGGYQYLALAQAGQGRFDEALASATRAATLQGWRPAVADGFLGYIHARAGNREVAQQRLDAVIRRSRTEYVPEDMVAALYAALGDKTQAFVWLEKATATPSPDVIYLKVDPVFDALRGDPRFSAALQRMHLKP